MSKIVLITGATAGIGRATALHLAELGHHVIATGRKSAELATLRTEARGRVDTMLLDVTSPQSIASAVTAVDELTHGRGIDVLVNNAGFGLLGPTMEISDSEMRRNYETNVFGLMNVTRAFARRMIERRSGRIVNVSSVGGRVSMPYLGVYFSTKHALEGLSDALRYELRPFNIDVSMVEPGFTRTNFEATAVQNLDAYASSPYGKAIEKYEELSKRANRFAADPAVISRAIARAVNARRPAARYVTPFTSNLLIAFARFAPQPLVDWTMRTVAQLTPATLGGKPARTAAN